MADEPILEIGSDFSEPISEAEKLYASIKKLDGLIEGVIANFKTLGAAGKIDGLTGASEGPQITEVLRLLKEKTQVLGILQRVEREANRDSNDQLQTQTRLFRQLGTEAQQILSSNRQAQQDFNNAVRETNNTLQIQARTLAATPEAKKQRLIDNINQASDPDVVEAQARRRLATIGSIINVDGGAPFLLHQAEVVAQFKAIDLALRGIGDAAEFPIKLQESMAELQSTTQSTSTAMAAFQPQLIALAENSRFSAEELVQLGVELGKSGFKLAEIAQLLKPISDFAVGSGLQIKEAGSLISNAITEFELASTKGTDVADLFTNALRNSRINAEVLASAVEHTASAANDAGIDLKTLTQTVAQLSQAGLVSAAQISGGLRQVIGSFTAPTQKFINELNRTGLSVEAVDLKSNSLNGVLKNLADSGFSASNAFEGLNNRTAIVLNALLTQVHQTGDLRDALDQSGTAAEAAALHTDTMDSALKRLRSSTQAVALEALTPFYAVLLKGVEGLGFFTNVVSGAKLPIEALGIAITSLGAAFAAMKLVALVQGLTSFARGALAAGEATSVWGVALRALTAGGSGPLLLITGAIAALQIAFLALNGTFKSTEEKLDELNSTFADAKGEFEEKAKGIANINKEIASLVERSGTFKAADFPSVIEELRKKFADLGIEIKDGTSDVGELIAALNKIKGVNLQEQLVSVRQELASQSQALPLAQQKLQDDIKKAVQLFSVTSGAGDAGFTGVPEPKQSEVQSFVSDVMTKLGEQQQAPNSAALAGIYGRINELRASASPDDRKRLDTLTDTLKQLKSDIDRISTIQRNITNLGATQSQVQFQQTDQFADFSNRVNNVGIAGKQFQSQLNDTGNSDRERLKLYEKMKPLVKQASDDALSAFNALPDDQKNSPEAQRLKQLIASQVGEFNQKYTNTLETVAKQDVSVAQAHLKDLELQLSTVEREAKSRNTPLNRIKDLAGQAADLQRRITEQQENIARDQFNKNKANGVPQEGNLNDIVASIDSEGRAKLEALGITFRDLIKRLEDPIDAFKQFMVGLDSQIKDFTSALKRVNDQAKAATKSVNDEIATLQSPQNEGRIPIQQIEAAQRAKFGRETGILQTQSAGLGGVLSTQTAAQTSAAAELGSLNAQAADIQARVADGTVTEAQKSELEKLQGEIKSVAEKLQTIQQDLITTKQQKDELDSQIKIRTDTPDPLTFGQTFNEGLTTFGKKSGAFDTPVVAFGRALPSVLDGASSAFARFTNNVLTGNQKIGDSLKQLGLDFLQLVAQVAEKQLAAQLVGGIAGLFGFGPQAAGAAGSGLAEGAGAGAADVIDSGIAVASQGWRHASLGISGRDSLPVLMDPREAILTPSATQLLGSDVIDRLNASGNRVASSATRGIQLPKSEPKQPVNVWVTQPDQVPPPGPRDIIAAVTQDIRTGGQTKQLIKTVMAGG